MTFQKVIAGAMRPGFAEQFEAAARAWVKLDHDAREAEDLKSHRQYSLMVALGDMPVAAAERLVKSSPEWKRIVEDTVMKRTLANEARVAMEKMRAHLIVLQATRLWPQVAGEELGAEREERGE